MAISNINLIVGQTFVVKANAIASNGQNLTNDTAGGKFFGNDTVTYSSSDNTIATCLQGTKRPMNYLLEAAGSPGNLAGGSTGTTIEASDGLSCLITAIGAGTATITVTSVNNGSVNTTFTVTVATAATNSLIVNAE